MNKILLASVATMAISATAASAATLEFTDSVSVQTTDWSETLAVSQFDSALGTLTSVMVMLAGGVEGEAKAESLDNAASTVTLQLDAEITASTALLGNVGTVLPVVDVSTGLTAFDGTIDFGGTSGFDAGTISATDSDMNTFFGVDMSEFIGAGTVSIFVAAEGNSAATGAGNIVSQFATRADATVTVKYTYDEAISAVPLPAGLVLMGTALAGLGLMRRKA